MKPNGAAGQGGSIINLLSVAGLISVPGHSAVWLDQRSRQANQSPERPALGILGQPKDIANAVLSLASEDTS